MRSNKSLGRYLAEAFERNPSLKAGFDETLVETELAVQLAAMREARGMTQRELASRAGMVQPMLNRIERSNQVPTATTLWRLMYALDAITEIGPSAVRVMPVKPISTYAQVIGNPFGQIQIPAATEWQYGSFDLGTFGPSRGNTFEVHAYLFNHNKGGLDATANASPYVILPALNYGDVVSAPTTPTLMGNPFIKAEQQGALQPLPPGRASAA